MRSAAVDVYVCLFVYVVHSNMDTLMSVYARPICVTETERRIRAHDQHARNQYDELIYARFAAVCRISLSAADIVVS